MGIHHHDVLLFKAYHHDELYLLRLIVLFYLHGAPQEFHVPSSLLSLYFSEVISCHHAFKYLHLYHDLQYAWSHSHVWVQHALHDAPLYVQVMISEKLYQFCDLLYAHPNELHLDV